MRGHILIKGLLSGLLASLASIQLAQACAGCGCSLSSDWEGLNFAGSSSKKLEIRYDNVDQTDLRAGQHRISAQDAATLTHNGDPLEVERYTHNQYYGVYYDQGVSEHFGINIHIPIIRRVHETLGTASDGVTAGPDGGQYTSSRTDLGDMRITGRYIVGESRDFGLTFGLKLPTGSTTRSGRSLDPSNPDPVRIDPGLQPGTGTTDIIIGAIKTGALDKSLEYFAQAQYQYALAAHDGYRPGNGTNISLGLKYMEMGNIVPQIQLNARFVAHDTGARADTVATGGTLVYFSPGLSWRLTRKLVAYGFVQVPILQTVRGVQLTPKSNLSIGLRYRL